MSPAQTRDRIESVNGGTRETQDSPFVIFKIFLSTSSWRFGMIWRSRRSCAKGGGRGSQVKSRDGQLGYVMDKKERFQRRFWVSRAIITVKISVSR